MKSLINRLFMAAPDAMTSALMLTAWIAPNLLGPEWVRNLALTAVIELFVMQLSLFYGVQKSNPETSRFKRALPFVAFTAIYVLFIAYFSAIFHNMWPLIAFGWLCVSRFASLWMHPDLTDQEERMMSLWLMSAVFYAGGVGLVVLIQVPPLGFTPAFIDSMDLSGSGGWIAKPYFELAFGFLYFGAVSCFKFFVTSTNTGRDDNIYHRDDMDVETGKLREDKGSPD